MAVISARPFPVILLFSMVLFAAICILTVNADCYTPDGQYYGDHQECYAPDVGAMTSCCHTLDKCLRNKLCTHIDDTTGNQTFYRGTCSNSVDWSYPDCPHFCMGNTEADSHLGDWPVGKCPGNGVSEDRWFCIGNETGDGTIGDCSNPDFGFTLPGGTAIYWTAGILPTEAPETGQSTVMSTWTLTWSEGAANTTSSFGSADSTPTSAEVSSVSPSVDDEPSSTSAGSSSTSVDDAPITTPMATSKASSIVPDISTSFLASLTLGPSSMPNPLLTVTVYPSPTGGASTAKDTPSQTVPIAVGASIGSVAFLALAALLVLCIRRRRRGALARAETPPPYEGERARFSWEDK